MTSEAWYAIYSKPHKESQVQALLLTQGIQTFYPTLTVKPVNPRSATICPYFPRYLFVHANLEEVGVNSLRWVPGAVGIVEFDGHPAIVPDEFIHRLRQYLEAHCMNGADLKPGDLVRINCGPLAGNKAIFDMRLSGSERVQILLTVLNHAIKVDVSANTIERLLSF